MTSLLLFWLGFLRDSGLLPTAKAEKWCGYEVGFGVTAWGRGGGDIVIGSCRWRQDSWQVVDVQSAVVFLLLLRGKS